MTTVPWHVDYGDDRVSQRRLCLTTSTLMQRLSLVGGSAHVPVSLVAIPVSGWKTFGLELELHGTCVVRCTEQTEEDVTMITDVPAVFVERSEFDDKVLADSGRGVGERCREKRRKQYASLRLRCRGYEEWNLLDDEDWEWVTTAMADGTAAGTVVAQ